MNTIAHEVSTDPNKAAVASKNAEIRWLRMRVSSCSVVSIGLFLWEHALGRGCNFRAKP